MSFAIFLHLTYFVRSVSHYPIIFLICNEILNKVYFCVLFPLIKKMMVYLMTTWCLKIGNCEVNNMHETVNFRDLFLYYAKT